MQGYLSEGVSPSLDGGLENTPNNRVRDAAMQDLTADGGTQTMRLRRGPQLDGYHFYSTPAALGQSALVQQTGLPKKPDERVRVDSEPIVETGPRPNTPYDPSLPQLIVKKIALAASKQGFAGGWRLAGVAGVDSAGNYTTTTDLVAFQHANGLDIEWYPPPDASPGTVAWAFFLSEEAATEAALNPSTVREQDRAARGTRKKLASGPYDKRGRKRPTTNETYIGRTSQPRWGGRNADLRYDSAPRDMAAVTGLGISFVFHTPRGDSKGSIRSQGRTFSAQKDHAVFVRPKTPPKNATGFKVYAHIGGVNYRVIRLGMVYKNTPFPLDEWVPVYANIASDEGSEGVTPGLNPDGTRKLGTTVLIEEDPPEEDASGVEAPTGQVDPPIGIGSTRPAAGTYWKTYAPRHGGVVGRAAVPVKVTITSTEMPRLEIPNPVNRLSNPAGTERNADGTTTAWSSVLTNGVLADVPGSKLGVATSGLINDTTSATPYRQSDYIPVLPGQVETILGILEVSSYVGSAGAGRFSLVQLKADGTTVITTLAERSTNGSTPVKTTVGPPGASPAPAVILDEGATHYALRVGTSAHAGRNMTVRFYNLAVGSPGRKFAFPPEGAAEIADPNAPPETPYPPGPVVCITRPPSAIPPPSFVPVGTLEAPANPTTQGWTANKTASGLVVLETGPPYRARSDLTNARAVASWSKTYPIGSGAGFVNGSSLAVRGPFRFPLLPALSGNAVIFLSIHDAVGNFMGFNLMYAGGGLVLSGRNRFLRDTLRVANVTLTPADLADIELIAGGGGTTQGRLSLLAGVAEARREVASIEGLDWIGMPPRQIRCMGVYEYQTADRWEVLCDWLRVTSSGDVVDEIGGSAELLPPDRPLGANGAYRELDEDGQPVNQLYIHIPPGLSEAREPEEYGAVFDDFPVKPGMAQTIAAYARYEDLAAQTTDTVRLTLFDKTNREWVAPSPLPASVSGTAGWTDLLAHLTPPAGFYRARLEVKRTEAGMLLVQEPIEADGEL